MAFWNYQGGNTFPRDSYLPKNINSKFSEKELIELAEQGQSFWSGIAKVTNVSVNSRDYGQGGMDTFYTTTIELELNGENGQEKFTLEYGSNYNPETRFVEGENIAFIGTKQENKLDVIMISEPADLEVMQSKMKTSIENGQAILRMNKLKEKLQVADALLIKPLKAAYAELKDSWENIKRERKDREEAAKAAAKAEREAKNNRPTGFYSQPEEQNRNNDISK